MAIRITVVERNWFNLLEALDDGEYDEPVDEYYPGADENGDCYWGEDETAQDENLEATVQKELKYS